MKNRENNILKNEQKKFRKFSSSERFRSLTELYWMNPVNIARDIRPLWDLRISSLMWNWELDDEDIECCELFENVKTHSLKRKMQRTECFQIPRVFGEINRDKSMFVLDRWLNEIELTPPVIVFSHKDSKWVKLDGFHRLAISFMCLSPEIPVWVLSSKGKVSPRP